MTRRQQLIAHKQHIQAVKNKLKQLEGIEVLEIYFEDENQALNELYSAYSPFMRSYDTQPYSRLSYKSAELQIIFWIIDTMKLREDEEYFYFCSGTWLKIRFLDMQTGIRALWDEHDFLLVNPDLTCIMGAGDDSRDEENYLIDIWGYSPKERRCFRFQNGIQPPGDCG